MGVEGVGVEQVQRVVQHRVPDPRDLPGGAHRVAEVGRDAAGQVQHERPAREDRQQHARERHPQQLCAPEPGRGRPAGGSPARVRMRRSAVLLAGAWVGRVLAELWSVGWRARRAGEAGAHRLLSFGAARIGAAYGSGPAPRVVAVCPSWRTDGALSGHFGEHICVRLSGMQVLVVGAGGVGAAFAAIAQRRAAFEQVVLADVSLERARAVAAAPRRARPLRRRAGRRLRAAASCVELIDRVRARRGAQRLRPALQRADLRRRLRRARHLPRHGDDAVAAPSPSARTSCRGRCSASTSWPGTRSGSRRACSRSSGSASSPACRTCSPATPPTSCSRASHEVGVRDGADLVVEGYDFAPTFSIWTTIEECLNPPLIWERERGFYTTAPFSEPEVFDVPGGDRAGGVRQRRARGGRADPPLGALRARHVQVRARPGVHRGAAHAAQARPGLDRARVGARAARSPRATSWPPRCPTRRRSASA